ncbi:unnamed protein product [Lactuca virosa]|uniref:Uncharacterized protein n=1 Tax=Lactuca virosa TaxID=75947 RepID=A0AAU9MHH2_9ASTR|nr:unnamed protein product [Lactuca virosa]
MSRAPSRSGVRKLVPSQVEDGQNRGGSDNINDKPLSFQHVAPRPPSLIQNLEIQDLAANPPSHNAVNPHQSTSAAEHLKVLDGTTTKAPPSAGGLIHGNRN